MFKKKTFIIAEAGVNHNGSLKIAKKLVNAAKKSGADYIKFQTFNTEDYVNGKNKKRYNQLKKFQFSREQFYQLSKQDYYIGFRPENLEIEEIFKGSKDNAFNIELYVNRVEFLGNDTLIYCSSDLTDEVITSKIISNEKLNIQAGNKYKFFVDNKSIFKYSKDTEKLI